MTGTTSQIPSAPTLLVVGAGGFIGGFIVEEGLRRGYDVWAGVRKSTSRKYLSDTRIHFAEFDYDDLDKLEEQLRENAPSEKGWDCIIWNLGATKCADFRDFNRINFLYVRNFGEILTDLGMKPERFLYVSSLSALGTGDEKSYKPLDSKMMPNPNTRYGLSKIKTEQWLETQSGLPWIIFRPTGVYGPHEQDYLMMIKSIDSGWDFGVGFKPQSLTFIYVSDLVGAMYDALAAPAEKVLGHKYIISEPRSYSQKEFRAIVLKELGKKFAIPVKLPMWAAYAASVIAEKSAALQGRPSTLNRDKYKIMKQRNWNCDVSEAERDFGFHADYPLEAGIRETVASYKAEKEAKKKSK